jgi:membrane dipeptidase
MPLVDGMGLFCARHGWPAAARKTPRSRAFHQIEMLRTACERSGGTAEIVTTREALATNLSKGKLSAILAMEGAYPLEGNAGALEDFVREGLRMLGPSHLIPNPFASCSYWLYRDRGLTGAGRELVAEMRRLGVILDVAHASPKTLDDLFAIDALPSLLTSHTGVSGVTPHWRNLRDDHVRQIAARGGVVSIILATQFLGGKTLGDFARHAKHAASIAGPWNVALGSDFDGFITPVGGIRDATDLPLAARALSTAGFDRTSVQGVMGSNLIRFLLNSLPGRAV